MEKAKSIKGVTATRAGKWKAQIRFEGRQNHLGSFGSEYHGPIVTHAEARGTYLDAVERKAAGTLGDYLQEIISVEPVGSVISDPANPREIILFYDWSSLE